MTDALLLEDIEEKDIVVIAAAFGATGYHKVGRAPRDSDVLAIFPTTKTVQAFTRGTVIKDEAGKELKTKKVTVAELINTLFGEQEADLIDDIVMDETPGDSKRPERSGVHSEKMLLENDKLKIVFCVHCARKMALGEAGVPDKFKQDEVIRLLVGTILNERGLLFK